MENIALHVITEKEPAESIIKLRLPPGWRMERSRLERFFRDTHERATLCRADSDRPLVVASPIGGARGMKVPYPLICLAFFENSPAVNSGFPAAFRA